MSEHFTAAGPATQDKPKPRFAIYKAADAPDVDNEIMPWEGMTPVDEAGAAQAIEAGLGDGAVVKLLFKDPVTGISLTYAWLKANYQLARHSHNADCAYYVVSGEAHLGTETLKAGDGFFVPADHLYAYQAGPDGVEVIEFRTAPSFHIRFSGNNAAFWSRVAALAADNHERWMTQPRPEAVRRFGATVHAGMS